MKRNVVKVFAAALALVVALGAAPLSLAANAQVQTTAQAAPTFGTLSVTGNGTIRVEPDIATIQVGVRVIRPTVSEAMQETTSSINDVVEALTELGIDTLDIQSVGFNMWPQWDWNAMHFYRDVTEPILIGYEITHTLSVIVRDIDQVGAVFEAATAAGANQNHSLSFSVDNTDELVRQAMVLAVKDAQDRAALMAELFGVELGAPVSIHENWSGVETFWGHQPIVGRMAMEMDAAGSMTVQTGQIMIRASISVTFGFDR